MRPAVREELLRINRAFYQSLALSFAATRRRPQPGVVRVLAAIDPAGAVLDVGCGHGLAAAQLARAGHHGSYLGIDSSAALIELARDRVDAKWASFRVADIADPGWCGPEAAAAFDWTLAFAVLHHLPGGELRLRVGGQIRSSLRPGGRAAISVWDFGKSERLLRRIVPWEEVGLVASEVDPGDTLLDWRHEGRGLRFVHQFSAGELEELARDAGFMVEQEFFSDGEGGRLGRYQLWRA